MSDLLTEVTTSNWGKIEELVVYVGLTGPRWNGRLNKRDRPRGKS